MKILSTLIPAMVLMVQAAPLFAQARGAAVRVGASAARNMPGTAGVSSAGGIRHEFKSTIPSPLSGTTLRLTPSVNPAVGTLESALVLPAIVEGLNEDVPVVLERSLPKETGAGLLMEALETTQEALGEDSSPSQTHIAGRRLQEAVTGERTRTDEAEPTSVAESPSSNAGLRPASERWYLKDGSYGSTSELLAAINARPELANGDVSYYHRVIAEKAPTRSEKIRASLSAAVVVGAVGAFIGALAGGALLLMALIGGVLTLMSYGHPQDPSAWLFLGPMAAGYITSAVMGFRKNWREMTGSQGFNGKISGTLRRAMGSSLWVFVPKGSSDGIDLAEHAAAPKYERPKLRSRWYDPFLGLAAAAALAASAFVPLGPGMLGAALESRLTKTRTGSAAGFILGLVFGYAAIIGLYHLAQWLGYWPVGVGLAALAKMGGRLLIPLWRRDESMMSELDKLAPWWRASEPVSKPS